MLTKCPEMVFHRFPVEERRYILDLLKKCVCQSKVIDTFPCENMTKMTKRIDEMAQVFCRPSDWLDHMVLENGVFLAMHTNFVYC